MKLSACSAIPLILSMSAAFGQTPIPVNVSAVDLMHGGIYRLRRVTMVDLVRIAWNVPANKVSGGPSWLEMDKFDILAKAPAGVTPESVKLMLRSLLQERFALAAHNGTKPMPAFGLFAGTKSALKKADVSGVSGCHADEKNADGVPVPTVTVNCHKTTMESFVSAISGFPGATAYIGDHTVVADRTGLEGEWDFSFQYSTRARFVSSNVTITTLADALDRQVGLKLQPADVPTPVVIVESVNETPTPNASNLENILPESVSEFEVADILPTDPDFKGFTFDVKPGGMVVIRGISLKDIIGDIWNLADEMVIGAPKSADSGRWDIVAKAPASAAILDAGSAQDADLPVDFDMVIDMLKNLLKDRFKLAFHMEPRPLPAYTLTALKPKMKKADPAERTKCEEGPAKLGVPDARDANPILGRLLTCRNTTMARLAELLPELANGYVHSAVLDSTGLAGGYDFTLSFSTIGQLRGGDGRGGDQARKDASASDPNGAISLPDAMEKQLGIRMTLSKRPVQVMVIDHLEAKPTDN
jgi:uncharacterized protein (TIGR03435 family)